MHPLTKLQLVICDLLDYDEQLIKRGESNKIKLNDKTNYIVVNSLSPALAQTKGQSFDDVEEVLVLATGYRMPVTIDFYGTDAYTNANKLQLMLKSDRARYLQTLHQLAVAAVSAVADVKQLTGQHYVNRYQLTLNLLYNESLALSTLRIDEAVIDIHLNR